MRVALYARVSTTRQAQAQGIEQQLDRLRAAAAERGWELEDQHVYRDDGYSGARLGRPGVDRLRDHAALADLDVVVVAAPDRLARNYVHQVLLIDELAARGCQVEFLDRPMSSDPHDQLLLQIRGAVAEYERTLIAERMRRGRQARLRAGTLLPWTTAPFGYRLDPDRPRPADPPPRVPAARADQLRCLPADLRCPPARTRLPLLPVPRAHRPAARRPGPALHGTLHPRRAAGRAGLGRPVRPGDRSRPGRPRARPGARRRLAAPGTPRPADGDPPGPGPAGPPAAAA